MAKPKYYAVARGRRAGIYTNWYGKNGAEAQIKGFSGAVFKGFPTRREAEAFLSRYASGGGPFKSPSISGAGDDPEKTVVYTDGGCISNPGPGGWGVVVIDGDRRRELSGGFRLTTNNRMELTACIQGLKAVDPSKPVRLYTDSQYVVNGITKGWAERWRADNWMRTETEKALNADLWEKLLDACTSLRVDFVWIKGHAGIKENERCDALARQAALQGHLPQDPGYEKLGKSGRLRRAD